MSILNILLETDTIKDYGIHVYKYIKHAKTLLKESLAKASMKTPMIRFEQNLFI